ncbi:hypothetical protein ACA910_002713 [Epithemia clementina (nom. ined.)]
MTNASSSRPSSSSSSSSSTTTTATTTTTLTWWDTTVLPRLQRMRVWYPVEWILAWIVVLCFAVKYLLDAAYHYLAMRNLQSFPNRWCRVVPLTTIPQTRQRLVPQEALTQLVELLRRQLPQQQQQQQQQQQLPDNKDQENNNKENGTNGNEKQEPETTTTPTTPTMANDDDDETTKKEEQRKFDDIFFSDDFIVSTMSTNLEARRLASMAMIPHFDPRCMTPQASFLQFQFQPHESALLKQLQRLWPQLLQLMGIPTTTTYKYDLSVIVPAYLENPISLLITLTTAWKHCAHNLDPSRTPLKIQVILVNAGLCGDDDRSLSETLVGHFCKTNTTKKEDAAKGDENETKDKTTYDKWSDFQILEYRQGGGRGGCMNFGAQHAQGRILTFLHSDVLLPENWDTMIVQTLRSDDDQNNSNNKKSSSSSTVNLCAFGMGIDDSPHRGLKGERYPPGLQAAAWQGRLRSNVCQLPYGDSVLSVRASAFDFVGGYPPNQPLMEDFALVQLFRQRAGLFPKEEPLAILPANIACSPRRWQQTNVPYVALANWTLLHKYHYQGATAEELYELYYGRPIRSTTALTTTTTTTSNNKEKTL